MVDRLGAAVVRVALVGVLVVAVVVLPGKGSAETTPSAHFAQPSSIPSCASQPPTLPPPWVYCDSGVVPTENPPVLPECPDGVIGDWLKACITSQSHGEVPPALFPTSVAGGSTQLPFTFSWALPPPCDFSTNPDGSSNLSMPCTYSGWSVKYWIMSVGPTGTVSLPAYEGDVLNGPDCGWANSCERWFDPLPNDGVVVLDASAGVLLGGPGGTKIDITPRSQTAITIGAVTPPPTPPTARFTAEERAPDSLQWDFDGTTSSAQGGATIVSWEWDFGDQTTSVSGAVVTHTFAKRGRYHVKLTVTDSSGAIGTIEKDVDVARALVVNSVGDAPNLPTSRDICDTGGTVGPGTMPECTLRAAIQAANFGGGRSIVFDIAGAAIPEISVGSALPVAQASVAIDGTTQPGQGLVRVSSDATGFDGFDLAGADSEVTGLVMNGFDTAVRVSGGGTRIHDNRFGTTVEGTALQRPPVTAVSVDGGTDVKVEGNVIAASTYGVRASGDSSGVVGANLIGVSASQTAALGAPARYAIALDGVGVWEVDGNTATAGRIAILLTGTSDPGTTITDNHVGNTRNLKALPSTGVGIFVDAVAGARVLHNVVTVARGGLTFSSDILVSGERLHDPAADLPSPRWVPAGSGSQVATVVEANTLGVLGDTPLGEGTSGITAFAGAGGVSVRGNRVAGHLKDFLNCEVCILASPRVTVSHNTVGVDAAGRAGIPGATGISIAGSAYASVVDNVVGGAVDESLAAGILVDYHKTVGSAELPSTAPVIRGNKVGITDADRPTENVTGIAIYGGTIDAVVGPDNVVANSTKANISVQRSTGTHVFGNRIGTNLAGSAGAKPLGLQSATEGVDVAWADRTRVADNIVGGVSTGIRAISNPAQSVEVTGNYVGRAYAGQPIENNTGISVDGGATFVHENRVMYNRLSGIVTFGTGQRLSRNMTAFNGVLSGGIDAMEGPEAPVVGYVRAFFGSEERYWIVVSLPGMPGELELFANSYCATNPMEGESPLPVRTEKIVNGTTTIFAPLSPDLARGVTATFTTSDGTTSTLGFTNGSTSKYSNCAMPREYPDSSGTGIPDVIQVALGGDPGDPTTARFPSDTMTPIVLETLDGRLRRVRPVSAPAVTPDGLTFPTGLFAFDVADLRPGGRADVVVSTTEKSLFYWRYGVPFPGLEPQWYSLPIDETTGLGAVPFEPDPMTGLTQTWLLHLQDGVVGSDDDLTENGTIVDPGGPANGVSADATPTASTPDPAAPAATSATYGGSANGAATVSTGASTGALPVTGADPRVLALVGLSLLAFGAALGVVPRAIRRGRPGTSRPSTTSAGPART